MSRADQLPYRYTGFFAIVSILVVVGLMVYAGYSVFLDRKTAALLVSLPAVASEKPQAQLSTSMLVADAHRITVEVARTEREVTRGLSFRESLPENHGMLFVFKQPEVQQFWMYGMKFPIDIIFIRDGHVVSVYERVRPPEETNGLPEIVSSVSPVDMVLELNAGEAAKFDLVTGAAVRLEK